MASIHRILITISCDCGCLFDKSLNHTVVCPLCNRVYAIHDTNNLKLVRLGKTTDQVCDCEHNPCGICGHHWCDHQDCKCKEYGMR